MCGMLVVVVVVGGLIIVVVDGWFGVFVDGYDLV